MGLIKILILAGFASYLFVALAAALLVVKIAMTLVSQAIGIITGYKSSPE